MLSVLRKIFFAEIYYDLKEIIAGNCSRKKLDRFKLWNISAFLRKADRTKKGMVESDNFESYDFGNVWHKKTRRNSPGCILDQKN